jgi:hypothetical protein
MVVVDVIATGAPVVCARLVDRVSLRPVRPIATLRLREADP